MEDYWARSGGLSWPDFRTKSPPWPENHTKTADPDNRTTHVQNGLKITLNGLEFTLIPTKNTEQ